MQQLLLELLTILEAVGDRNESLFDTDVREAMGEAIFVGFVRQVSAVDFPDTFGLPEEADLTIRAAIQSYIERASRLAHQMKLDTFHERLAAFQDSDVITPQGNDFEEFFGWSDPNAFDIAGNIVNATWMSRVPQ